MHRVGSGWSGLDAETIFRVPASFQRSPAERPAEDVGRMEMFTVVGLTVRKLMLSDTAAPPPLASKRATEAPVPVRVNRAPMMASARVASHGKVLVAVGELKRAASPPPARKGAVEGKRVSD